MTASRTSDETIGLELGRKLLDQPACGRGDPALLEERVRDVLVSGPPHDLGVGKKHDRVQLVAPLGQQQLVEVGQRDHQPDVVNTDQLLERGQIAWIVDPRDDRMHVGVVDRGRELVGVDRERAGAGPAERGHDIHALPGAGEEDAGHGRNLAAALW